MKKLFKYLLIAFVVVAILVTGLLVTAYFLIDPNDYQEDISLYVKEQTGRDLVIAGDIEKSIYPLLGVRIPEITLSNPPGFSEKPFFKIREAQVGVKLMPIFDGILEAEKVRLVGLEVNLERNANGTFNWDDLTAKQTDDTPQVDDEPAEKSEGKPMQFSFQGFELIDALITWTDVTSGQKYTVDDVNLTVTLEELNRPFDINFNGKVMAESPYLESMITLASQIQINESFDQFDLSGLALEVVTEADGLPKGGIKFGLNSDIQLSLAKQTASIDNLKLSLNDLEINGNVDAENLLGLPKVTAEFNLAELNPRQLASNFEIPLPETGKPTALSRFNASMSINADTNSVKIEPIKITLDETSLSGKVGISNFNQPAIRFSLAADKINLDDYLPPPSESEQTETTEQTAAPAEEPDLSALEKLDLQGTIEVGEITVKNLKSTDIKLTIFGKDGKIKIDPIIASLYQGSLDGAVELDTATKKPVISIKKSLSSFMAGPFTADLLGKEQVNGIAQFDIDMKSTGLTPDTIMRNLNGKGSFRFNDGAIAGINLGLLLRKAIAKINNQPAPADEPLKTDFALLEGSFIAKDGIIENQDLSLMSPAFRVSGEGKANLPEMSLDYLVIAAVAGTAEGQGGKGLDELKDIPVPVRLKGPFSDIEPSIDTQKLYEMLAKSKVEKETKKIEQKAKQKIEEKLGDKLDKKVTDKLKGLFGR